MPLDEVHVRESARALSDRGDAAELERLLAPALQDLGYPVDLTLALLDAYGRGRRGGEFKALFRRAIRSGAEPARIAREVALRMEPTGPETLRLLRLAAIVAPGDPASLSALAHCYNHRGSFDAALSQVRRHNAASGRGNLLAWKLINDAWTDQRWDSAAALLTWASASKPGNQLILSYLHTAREKHARDVAFPGAFPIAALAGRLLPPGDRTSILYVGARGENVDVRFRGIPAERLEVIGVDPELETASDPSTTGIALRYLRDALSDREEERTFFETAYPGGSSLFEASAEASRYSSPRGVSWGEMLRVKERRRVRTTTVDAVAGRGDLGRIDSLYVNVQGSELAILRGGRQTFADTVAVQAEVSFVPVYAGAPDWRAVDAELLDQGFMLIDIRSLMTAGRSRVGFALRPDKRIGYERWPSWQIAEAHLLYLRDPLNPASRAAGRFRATRDWLVFALWAEYHGQVEIALEALLTLAAQPDLVDDADLAARLQPEIPPIVERYRSYFMKHYS